MLKKLLSLLLAAVLTVQLLPVPSRASEPTAEEPSSGVVEMSYVNPLYAHVLTEADLDPVPETPDVPLGDGEYLTTVDQVGDHIRAQMCQRNGTVTVKYQSSVYDQLMLQNFMDAALVHNGISTQGDYLRWQYGGANLGGSYHQDDDGTFFFDLTITLTYYTTYDQEMIMGLYLANLKSELNLDGRSDYEKIEAIYDWMCANITYDYTSTGTLKHTAYAALVNKTAVCQGYAVLLYRLLLEEGIDCRLVAGTGNGGPHGWNIVELGRQYYNVDATWDAGQSSYDYFLRSPGSFPDHTRDTEYDTAAFHENYPMASQNFNVSSCPHTDLIMTGWTDATCTEEGYTGNTVCRACGYIWARGSSIAALGHQHTLAEGKDATCEEDGYTSEEICARCGKVFASSTVIPALGHDMDLKDAVEAACETDGYSGDMVCRRCDYVLAEGEVLPALGHDYAMFTCTRCGQEDPNKPQGDDLLAMGRCGDNVTWSLTASGRMTISGTGDMYNYDYYENPIPWTEHLESIRTAVMEEGVTSVSSLCFTDCVNLTDVTIPSTVKSLGNSCFAGCSGLTSIVIPDSVTTLGDECFIGCTSLTDILVPASVKNIGLSCFTSCWALNGSFVAEDNPWYSSKDGALYNKEFTAILNYTGAETSFVIPNSVTSIGDQCFYLLTKITSITIPNSVTDIGYLSFGFCMVMPSITIPENVRSLGDLCFSNCHELTSVIFLGNAPAIGDRAFNGVYASATYLTSKSGWNSQTLANYGGELTWRGQSGHLHHYIPTVVEPTCTDRGYTHHVCACGGNYISHYVDALGHEEETIPGREATCMDPGLTEGKKCTRCGVETVLQVQIDALGHDYVNYICTRCGEEDALRPDDNIIAQGECGAQGDNVKWKLTEDGTLTISGSGSMMDYGASSNYVPWFGRRSYIQTVIVEPGVQNLGNYSFYNCEKLTSVTLPEGITDLGTACFENCEALTEVTLPEGIFSLGNRCFASCTSLTEMHIPEGVTGLGEECFLKCAGLTSVTLPEGITRLEDYTFNGCSALTGITIPESVTTIGMFCFSGCNSLVSVTLPKNIKRLGYCSFAYCRTLSSITFCGNAPAISELAFLYVTATAYYPIDNPTWTADVMQNYDGTITWEPYEPEHIHSYTSKITDPTCTEEGFTTYTCTCGNSYEEDFTPALGHDYGSWQPVNSTTERRTCSRCDAYEEREILAEDVPRILVAQVKAQAGKTVEVPVTMEHNPGINTMTLSIVYDTEKLTLNKVTPAPELGGSFQYSDRTHAIIWQTSSDISHNGTILTLSFTVAEDAQAGEIPVTITYKPGNICNYDEEDVDFAIIPGGITVQEYTPGDINGDQEVNNKDLNRLMKYLIDDAADVSAAALDVNGDGAVNNKDLNRLMKYLLDDTTEIF